MTTSPAAKIPDSLGDMPFNVTDLIRRPAIRSEIVPVSPAVAAEWLVRNDHNRRVRAAVVRQYARDMRAGRWLMTGEAIKFSADGRLIDGQHRLYAVLDAATTVDMLVITGLTDESQDVMDTGSKRGAADMLTLGGYTNASLLAAATKWIILHDEDRLYTDRANRSVTHADVRDYIRRNPELEDVVSLAGSVKSRIDLQPAILAAALWIITRADREEAAEFLSRWADGIDLSAGSPILALRNRLRQIKKNRTRVEPEALLSLTVRAWNAWRDGRTLAALPTHKAGAQIRCPKAR